MWSDVSQLHSLAEANAANMSYCSNAAAVTFQLTT